MRVDCFNVREQQKYESDCKGRNSIGNHGNPTGFQNFTETFNGDNVSQVTAGDMSDIISGSLCLNMNFMSNACFFIFSCNSVSCENVPFGIVSLSFAKRCLGNAHWTVSLGVAISAFGAVNDGLLVTSRIPSVATRYLMNKEETLCVCVRVCPCAHNLKVS